MVSNARIKLPREQDLSSSQDLSSPNECWICTEEFFRDIKRGSSEKVVAAYLPDAVLDNPVIGHVAGDDIRHLWTTFLHRTREHRLEFTLTSVVGTKVLVDWTTQHEFFETGRPIALSGTSELTFADGHIKLHRDTFDWRKWLRQALGPSGLILSYLPGAKAFLRSETRRAFGLTL